MEPIKCESCGAESFLKRSPQYEGFVKSGETLSCAACGHAYEKEADVPFTGSRRPQIFTKDDQPKEVKVFHEDEKGKVCRYCEHYVVNPFTQRCALHLKEVQATDFCDDFSRKKEVEDDSGEQDV